jgi:hypothetical protein
VSSVFAVDAWVLFGAFVQCALILRARRFSPGGWKIALGMLCALPLVFLAYLRLKPDANDSIGLGLGAMTGADADAAADSPPAPAARKSRKNRRALLGAAIAVLVGGLHSPARAASDDDDAEESSSDAAPAASTAAPVFAPRPDHVVMGDTNSDPGKVFRARGGPGRAVVPGGAVIINADGTRLEIAPTKRPAMQNPAVSPPPAGLTLPALPALVDPKAPLPKRKERALQLLGASLAAMMILIHWARRRWRPGA